MSRQGRSGRELGEIAQIEVELQITTVDEVLTELAQRFLGSQQLSLQAQS